MIEASHMQQLQPSVNISNRPATADTIRSASSMSGVADANTTKTYEDRNHGDVAISGRLSSFYCIIFEVSNSHK
jgi:hypothetical protein